MSLGSDDFLEMRSLLTFDAAYIETTTEHAHPCAHYLQIKPMTFVFVGTSAEIADYVRFVPYARTAAVNIDSSFAFSALRRTPALMWLSIIILPALRLPLPYRNILLDQYPVKLHLLDARFLQPSCFN